MSGTTDEMQLLPSHNLGSGKKLIVISPSEKEINQQLSQSTFHEPLKIISPNKFATVEQ